MVITILEDNPIILEETAERVRRLRPNCTLNTFSSIASFISEAANATEILISDICLEDGDAIDELVRLQQKNDNMKIIYMTGFIENSKRIFKSRPSYFLVKPFSEQELLEAIEKCECEIESENDDIFFVPTNGGNIILRRKRIKYIESNGRKLIIHKLDGDVEYYGKLDTIGEMLESSFLRCHKSFLVNMVYIKAFVGNEITLTTGEILPVSRGYHMSARNAHTVYLGGLLK